VTFEELHIDVKPGKVRWSSSCPQCDSTRKHKGKLSLTVNNEAGNRWYKCWNCNFSGNLDLQDKYEKVQEKSRMPKQMVETYSKEVREYLEKRGIDQKTALKEKIYEYSMRTADGSKPIMGFPFYINLTLVNVKFFDVRWQPGSEYPKWRQLPRDIGSKSIFLGMQNLSFDEGEKKEVIITEGEWDWLTWKQCGYKNVVSVPMGAPNPNAKEFEHEFDYANDKYVQSFFADVETIIFSTDNDAPGHVLRNQLALIFGKDRCKYVNYPVGYKDANDVFKGNTKGETLLPALGKAGVDECYGNLSSFPIAGIIRPSQVREQLEILAKEGFTGGYKCGVPEIDYLYTEKGGRVQVVTGSPGEGKSTYVRWHEIQVVIHNADLDLKYGWFSPENRPVWREYAKMAETVTGQFYKEGWKNSMTPELRHKTLRWLEKHFFIIAPDRKNFNTFNGKIKAERVNTLESICEYLVYLKKTEGITGYVIDAWNKIEHEQPKNITETNYISSQLDHLVDFNDYYDLHGIIIAHPTKIEKIGFNYRMPCLGDIKGSSAWREKSDIGIIIHRNMNKRKKKEDIPDDADEDDKYYVDETVPTILRTERIKFEEEGHMNRIKLQMDTYRGGKFTVVKEEKREKAAPEPIKGALNPPKNTDDDMFNGNGSEKDDLPF
jgi:twinkle protein